MYNTVHQYEYTHLLKKPPLSLAHYVQQQVVQKLLHQQMQKTHERLITQQTVKQGTVTYVKSTLYKLSKGDLGKFGHTNKNL